LLIKHSVRPAKSQDIKAAWGDWVDQVGGRKGGWDWFATLTFKPVLPRYRDFTEHSGILYQGRTVKMLERPGYDKPGWGYSEGACNKFLAAVGEQKGLGDFWWFRAREIQPWRGVPHWHLLLGGVKDLLREEAWSWWFPKYGQARVLPYQAELGARFYLCKYVTKELGDISFSQNLRQNT
jgi:hypothetical protein